MWVDAGDGARAPRLVRGVQHGPATSCRWPRSARRCPTGARSPAGRSSASTPRGCCARPRARPRRRPQRASSSCRPTRRSACRTARRSASTDDVVLDLDVTRNRPDCWSYVGVARDLAAKLGVAVRPPSRRRWWPRATSDGAAVEIVDGDRCGRFTSTVLSGVEVGPSAPWMAERLTAAGHASDQQRRRRQQLRDARARPAQPRLRPAHPRRRRLPHPAGRRRRDADDARRRRAPARRPTTC